LAVLTYFPVFSMLTEAANPDLAAAQTKNKVVVTADPNECSFQFNPTGVAKFTSSCDLAKQKLAARSVSYENASAPAGTPATIKVGETVITGYTADKITDDDMAKAKDAATKKLDDLKAAAKPEAEIKVATDALAAFAKDAKAATVKAKDGAMNAALGGALKAAGYPDKADPAKINKPMIVAILVYLVILVTMVYGPIAAMLVEMFPTRIRYTSMSLPYHIGNGWFGGLLPATALAIVAQTGNMYNGLWYPIIVAGVTFVIGMLFVRETKDVDIYAKD
jgi:hypothetical protein